MHRFVHLMLPIVLLIFSPPQTAAIEPALFRTSAIATYYAYSGIDCEDVCALLEASFQDITSQFGLVFEGRIEVHVFACQQDFWEAVFPGRPNNHRTTGFADMDRRRIYLASPSDTSVRPASEIQKVPRHELVHILLPHRDFLRREGIAVYLADQLNPVPEALLPVVSEESIRVLFRGFETGDSEMVRAAYNLSGWRERFIYEECFGSRALEFLRDFNSMAPGPDYETLGFDSADAFYAAFTEYLCLHVLET